jgi:hypothetical protein
VHLDGLSDARKSTLLLTILLLVVGGNSLVIASVLLHRTLHTTTNYLITSLALSDLLLGITVLPFSVFLEVCTTCTLDAHPTGALVYMAIRPCLV